MTLRVLFAGGGSGGHVFPLVAVCEALRALRPDLDATFVGTKRGMEATLIPARGEKLELVDVLPIKGVGAAGALKGVARAASSLWDARPLVARLDPHVVFSIGGYAAGPVALAAKVLGIAVTLHEPNSVLGLSNWIMTPLVTRAYVAYPEVEKRFRPSVARRFGVPLRPGFAPSVYAPEGGRAKVLVLGGSQGASALNERMPKAFAALRKEAPHATIVHQAGKGKDAEVRARYEALGLGAFADVRAFVDDVPKALEAADVVVTRAGAGSVAEITAVGRAAIFVPYPTAADDHQRKNADSLAKAGAGVSIAQLDATDVRLGSELIHLFASDRRRVALAEAARNRGVPNAAARIASDLLALALAHAAERSPVPSAGGASLCSADAFATCISSASAASA